MVKSKKEKLNFIDVFAGAGGLSCGLEMAGMRCLLGVDINQHAMDTFAANHKHADVFSGNIYDLDDKTLKKLVKNQPIHAVVGGPPCQGFSTVGTGDPKDQRNSLFLQFVRIVRITKPYFIILENVTGLLAKKNEPILKNIFKRFAALGYSLDARVLSAQEFGVPEKRRRTIIMGTRLGHEPLFPKSTHDTIIAKTFRNPVTVGDALKDLATKGGAYHNHDLEAAKLKSDIDAKRLKCIPEGKGIRYQKDEQAYLPKRLRLDVNWDELLENRFRQTKYQRLDRKKPSPTIMTHRHSYFHPTENRYLTQREAARLQSFPNNFIFSGSVSAQWKQIGNAVPPLLGKALGKSLLKMHKLYLEDKKSLSTKVDKKKVQKTIKSMRENAFVYTR
jgi:DNA (cytosine-5)-methyltransferase 1